MQKERPHRWMHLCRATLSILLLFVTISGQAGMVSFRLEPQLVASAEYLPGNPDASPVLILHGFLQTRDFITVRTLAEALHELGHTILLPNLTLGISARKQSLSCEAIHTHSMAQDSHEVNRWVDWLHTATERDVVVIGHSIGSLQLLAHLSENPSAPVSQAIFVSLTPYGEGPVANETLADRLRAEQQLQASPGDLDEYGLAYCRRYLTTPARYLSYVSWDRDNTLRHLSRLQLPMSVILGSADQRIQPSWREQLDTIGMHIVTVEGANHFFDQQHEFDLLDAIVTLIR